MSMVVSFKDTDLMTSRANLTVIRPKLVISVTSAEQTRISCCSLAF